MPAFGANFVDFAWPEFILYFRKFSAVEKLETTLWLTCYRTAFTSL